jgi:hypothetical protein
MDIKDKTNWIKVNYTYMSPSENYLDGPATEEVQEEYFGPDKIFVIVNNDNGKIHDVWVESEKNDGRPVPFNHNVIVVQAKKEPLLVEVLSDYHNNVLEGVAPDDHLTLKQIGIDGYTKFEYTFPIHPDELYDDSRCYYDWNKMKFILVNNTNVDIIGEFPGWEANRERRNFLLERSDMWLLNPSLSEEKIEEVNNYKQQLRDFPALWEESGIDDIFSDSCWPIKPDGFTI